MATHYLISRQNLPGSAGYLTIGATVMCRGTRAEVLAHAERLKVQARQMCRGTGEPACWPELVITDDLPAYLADLHGRMRRDAVAELEAGSKMRDWPAACAGLVDDWPARARARIEAGANVVQHLVS